MFSCPDQLKKEEEIKKRIKEKRARLNEMELRRQELTKQLQNNEDRLENVRNGEFDEEWLSSLDLRSLLSEKTFAVVKEIMNLNLDNHLLKSLIEKLNFDKKLVKDDFAGLISEIQLIKQSYNKQLHYLISNNDELVLDLSGTIIKLNRDITALENKSNSCGNKWVSMLQDTELKQQYVESLDFQIERQNELINTLQVETESLKEKTKDYVDIINETIGNEPKSMMLECTNLGYDNFSKKQDIIKHASLMTAEVFKWFMENKSRLEEGNAMLSENNLRLKEEQESLDTRMKEINENVADLKNDARFDQLYQKYDELKDLKCEQETLELEEKVYNGKLLAFDSSIDKLFTNSINLVDALLKKINTKEEGTDAKKTDVEFKRAFLRSLFGFIEEQKTEDGSFRHPTVSRLSEIEPLGLYENIDKYLNMDKENSKTNERRPSYAKRKRSEKIPVSTQLCVND